MEHDYFNYLELVAIRAQARFFELRHQEIITRLNASFLTRWFWRFKSLIKRLRSKLRGLILANPILAIVLLKKNFKNLDVKSVAWEDLGDSLGILLNEEGAENFSKKLKFSTGNKKIAFIHAFYLDSLDEILKLLLLVNSIDILITTPKLEVINYLNSLFGDRDDIIVMYCDNHGRDVLPFLSSLAILDLSPYEIFVKLHTKRSYHLPKGMEWYHKATYSIVGNPFLFEYLAEKCNVSKPILIGFETLPVNDHFSTNFVHMNKLIPNFNKFTPGKFIPGTIFMGNQAALKLFVEKRMHLNQFEFEAGQLDSTLPHALERFFGYICLENEGSVETVHEVVCRSGLEKSL